MLFPCQQGWLQLEDLLCQQEQAAKETMHRLLLRYSVRHTEVLHTSDGMCGCTAGRIVTNSSLTQFTQQPLPNVLLGSGKREGADEGRGGWLRVGRNI